MPWTERLKERQAEAVKYIYEGQDVFLWLRTGYGKSICYQLLPFLFDYKLARIETIATERSVVLVISPLVSLMVDQVSNLQAHGIGAAILSGNAGINKVLLASERDVTQHTTFPQLAFFIFGYNAGVFHSHTNP